MSKSKRRRNDQCYEVIKTWRDECLVRDFSLFTPRAQIWGPSTIQDLYERFVDSPDYGSGSFIEKLEGQLSGAPQETVQLAAEMLFVHFQGAKDIQQKTKREVVDKVLGWMRPPIAVPPELVPALDGGFASTGVAYKTLRPFQTWQILTLAREVKSLPRDERARHLGDPWAFKELLFAHPVQKAQTQRNALLHLFFPSVFEPTVSDNHKHQIAGAFSEHIPEGEEDLDRQLAAVRSHLERDRDHRIDFYSEEFRSVWDTAAKTAGPSFWWVNQGKTYNAEFEGGLIWAPQKDKKGNSLFHHKNVSAVKEGDVIAHYTGGAVQAVSIADTDGYGATRPTSITTGDWQREGWQVDTTYHVLAEPVQLQAISSELSALNLKKGPINSSGGVNQGYLYRLSPPAIRVIAHAAGSSLPAAIAEAVGLPPRPEPPTPTPASASSTSMDDLNVILYGPPGTGKTFATARKAVEIIDGQAPAEHGALMRRFSELRDELNQVAFVTFHQSYSYEEFVEGIRPVISEPGESDSDNTRIEYECRRGVFRNICSLAAGAGARSRSSFQFDPDATRVWKMSLGNTRNPEDAELYDDAIEGGLATLGYGKGLDFTGCDDLDDVAARLREKAPDLADNDYNITAVNTFKNLMVPGDLIVVSDGNTKFRAIGRVTGEYQFLPRERHQQTRAVEWLLVLEDSLPRERILNKNFSQATIYRLKKRVLKADAFREIMSGDQPTAPREHVLIIDEINRGNIAKILGELITLLEPDKRIGAQNEVQVTLPYSGDQFGVPANLHVIGTMNTADRSIAFIDTALRRRFRFEEMMPESSVIRRLVGGGGKISGVDVAALLDRINERVELLYDRDHTIGHAYFLKAQDLPGLREVFIHRVIPLLQEYFYGDWTRVALVLGCPYDVEAKTPKTQNPAPLLSAQRLELTGLRNDHDIEPGVRFSVNPDFINASVDGLGTYFRGVLADQADSAEQ